MDVVSRPSPLPTYCGAPWWRVASLSISTACCVHWPSPKTARCRSEARVNPRAPLWVARRSRSSPAQIQKLVCRGLLQPPLCETTQRIISIGQKFILLSSFFLDEVGISDKKGSIFFFTGFRKMKHFNKANEKSYRDLIWMYVNVHLLNAYECISVNVFGCVSSFGKPKFVNEWRGN